MKNLKSFALALIALVAAITATAQSTTASLHGFVTDNNGKPLMGATVVATHTPTETVYGTITDAQGAYHLQGLRVGSPYTIEFSFVGYGNKVYNDIALSLGENQQVDASLSDTQTIDAVVVQTDGFINRRTGSGEVFHRDLIERTPTVSRSIDDITRLAPQAMVSKDGGISIAGMNSRYNSFQIDGTASNDMYGLTSSGTNGGLAGANPIPLDAISDIQVVTAPFDVRQGGFSGGGINAITKSGTNTFSGTVYNYYNDQDFYGRGANGEKLAEQRTRIYGVSLGGAIVKNKLFFFLNGEFNLDSSPSSYYVGDSGCNITEADAAAIAKKFDDLTGYSGGGYGRQMLRKQAASLIARLDWNINSRHNLTLRYNFLDAKKDEFQPSATTFRFNGEGYASPSDTHSLVAELNSRVSDKMFNEVRVGYTRVHDGRDAMSGTHYPNVVIDNVNGSKVRIGTEPNSVMNNLVQNTITITDNFSYYTNAHTITVGTHNEIFNSSCIFMSNAMGSYTYNTLDDFLNDSPSKYQRSYAIGNPATKLTTAQFALYIQDEWNASPRFSMTYGLRADIPVVFGNPPTNEAFNSSAIAEKYGVKTNQVPSPTVLLSPRLGFRWRIAESANSSTLLRGGVGIFSGRIPFVWISNCFSNSGMTKRDYTLYDEIPGFGQDPTGATGVIPNPSINVVAKNFRYPQVARATLALEQEYKGWHFILEGVFSKSINDLLITNLTAQDKGGKLYAVNSSLANANNTTTLYDKSLSSQNSSIYLLSNTSKGYGYSVSASVAKSFRFGLDLYAAYTFAHSYSVMDGVSATNSLVWSRNYSSDSNNHSLSYSIFDVPHKITASVSYTKRYAGLFGTTISLIYQGYSGMRYSLTYSGEDINNDTGKGNTTIYIPTESELAAMDFVRGETDRAAFGDYIASNPTLRRSRGKFLGRNAMQTPFEHHLDLHIAQDFYFSAESSRKVQISLDIMNLGALFSKDWGASYYTSNYCISPISIKSFTTDAEGNRTPKYEFVGGSVSRNDLLSRWRMQVGVRVVF